MAKKSKAKLPDYSFESCAINKGFCYIAGADEVGYGPGAGPVVAAAARIPNGHVNILLEAGKIRDSKKMTEKCREEAYKELIEVCDYGIGIINNDIIDEINILEATKLAMSKAIYDLDFCDYVLIDGNVVLRDNGIKQEQIIKGDNKSLSIAAASIIAKVTRDRIMRKLHSKFPLYHWDSNKGYLTKAHLAALKKYGPSPWHRLSYRRVGK
ncbi:MAG TPA: ribonuclease HII [Methanosarcinales archaeon]|nr:ribonuclease HII [Methanosarcinales archaeon]